MKFTFGFIFFELSIKYKLLSLQISKNSVLTVSVFSLNSWQSVRTAIFEILTSWFSFFSEVARSTIDLALSYGDHSEFRLFVPT